MSGAAIASAYAPQAVLQLLNAAYTDTATDPGGAAVILSLSSAGVLTATGTDGGSYNYLTGDSPALYEVYFHPTSGTVSSGTIDTWLPLSSTRQISVSRSGEGGKFAIVTVSIGLLGTSTALVSASIELTATVESGA